MSGHSKWAKIKRQKGANDVKRGAMFTKVARNIIMAAKEGGVDPDTNFTLRMAIDKAKSINMPSDNIERAIKKGAGGDDKTIVQKITYEAVMGNGSALVIDCSSDNTNRTVAEVKKTLEVGGAKLASIGSVAWQFEEFGLITVKPAKLKKAEKYGAQDTYESLDMEETEMTLLEVEGVTDINESEAEDEEGNLYKVLEVYTDKNDFSKVHKDIEGLQLQIVTFELIKKAKDLITLSEQDQTKVGNLIGNLDDLEDVDAVWVNVK